MGTQLLSGSHQGEVVMYPADYHAGADLRRLQHKQRAIVIIRYVPQTSPNEVTPSTNL